MSQNNLYPFFSWQTGLAISSGVVLGIVVGFMLGVAVGALV